jgi:sigma-B regulation protein RsbU (phosphoserine phosphatase)
MVATIENTNANLQKANDTLKIVNHDLQIAQSKINRDLEHARKIQQGLLPINIPQTTALTVAAQYIPASAVGGDYYDIFEIGKGIYGIIMADVSGHGVSSSLIMSMVKVLLKAVAPKKLSPQATLEQINTMFLTEIKTDNFVTIFYAVVDTNRHTITYTSAGHCPIFVVNKQTRSSRQIKADGLFLGVFPDMMLNETKYAYKAGIERLVLYTDGLTEAKNDEDEMFGMERLEHISRDTLEMPPEKVVEKIVNEQKLFSGKGAAEDDITLLVLDF